VKLFNKKEIILIAIEALNQNQKIENVKESIYIRIHILDVRIIVFLTASTYERIVVDSEYGRLINIRTLECTPSCNVAHILAEGSQNEGNFFKKKKNHEELI
jgi:hypothetical protein